MHAHAGLSPAAELSGMRTKKVVSSFSRGASVARPTCRPSAAGTPIFHGDLQQRRFQVLLPNQLPGEWLSARRLRDESRWQRSCQALDADERDRHGPRCLRGTPRRHTPLDHVDQPPKKIRRSRPSRPPKGEICRPRRRPWHRTKRHSVSGWSSAASLRRVHARAQRVPRVPRA